MPADEYSSVARGPLKLKGAKVTKHKKKSKKDKEKATSDVERALATTTTTDARPEDAEQAATTKQRGEGSEDVAERSGSAALEDDTKTETERRFAETKRKRLKELTESGRVRPELLKTHKQRVEDLNSHLSRLSEHHDMPKIGPG
ncbi:protein FAM32A [Podospora conica]|nr:protein FAM32A [Schizothecium conicum]